MKNGDWVEFWIEPYVTGVDTDVELELKDLDVTVAPHAKRGKASLTWEDVTQERFSERIILSLTYVMAIDCGGIQS